MYHIMHIPKSTILFSLAAFIIGGSLSFLFFNHGEQIKTNKITHDQLNTFTYTSPILDCEEIEQGGVTALSSKELNSFAQSLALENSITDYSIYFRDLNNGPWLGINEKEPFSPASLMKTPLLIAFLKSAENNPELLAKKIVLSETYFQRTPTQNIPVTDSLEKNKEYTLLDIAKAMIHYSDNVAALVLYENTQPEDRDNLFKSVGIVLETNTNDVLVRVKDFASFFRILYNSSYLQRENSELALSILSETNFKSGIVAGLPDNVKVSHKYGERTFDNAPEKQLHDCGIVYYEKSPYILCIMTKSKDFAKQETFIAGISKFIYDRVSQ